MTRIAYEVMILAAAVGLAGTAQPGVSGPAQGSTVCSSITLEADHSERL